MSVTRRICDHIGTNRESVRNPCPIGPPNGDCAVARSGSTWIHWWSSVASAKVFTRSWVTSNHSLVPSTWPLSDGSSASVVVVAELIWLSPFQLLPVPGGSGRGDREERLGRGG